MSRNKLFIFPLAAMATLSMSSCSFKVTKDPNEDFKKEAIEAYKKLRQKLNINDNDEYHAWYYNPSLLKGVVFNSLNDYTYLGIINFQNLCFSETENNYYLDIPNYKVSYDSTNNSFEMPSFINEPINFVKNLPMVLVKDDEKLDISEDVYTKFDINGNIDEYAFKENYDPTLYYLDGFKIDLNIEKFEEFNVDYTNKSTAILKRDVYTLIEDTLKNSDVSLPFDLSLSKILLKSYNKANKLSNGEKVPSTINFRGKFNNKNVAIGPLGLTEIFTEESYKEIKNATLEEGITDLCFFAFDNATNLNSINIPSTLNNISLSALSNLNLDYLYISDSDKKINFIETKGASFTFDFNKPNSDETIKLNISSQLNNTKINNLIFENYDNVNVDTFPYNDINLNNKKLEDIVIYIDKDGNKKYESISEGFKHTDAINPLFQLDIQDKIISDKNFNKIEKDKTLYLGNLKSLPNGKLLNTNLNNFRNYDSNLKEDVDAIYTLKLESDLTIEGRLITGASIGKKENATGLAISNYVNIDLNGFNITINNGGLVDLNGKVIDSSLNKKGQIIVNSGGIIKTNLVLHENINEDEYSTKLANNLSPFNDYDFSDLDVTLILNNGSNLYAKTSLVDENNVSNDEFLFFGNINQNLEAYFKVKDNKSGYLKISHSDKSIFEFINLDVEVNNLKFINSDENNDIYIPLTNNNLDINLVNSTFNLTNHYKLTNGGKLNIDKDSSLIINKDLFIYSKFSNDYKKLNLNYDKDARLFVEGNILFTSNDASINGSVYTSDNSKFNYLVTLFNSSSYQYNKAINDGYFDDESLKIISNLRFSLSIINESNNKKYIRNNKGYYYLYDDGNSFINSINNNNLANKTSLSDNNWVINYNNVNILTNNKDDKITTYHRNDEFENSIYTLTDEGSWIKVIELDPVTHTYKIDGKYYIDYKNNLYEGIILENKINNYYCFKINDGDKKFIYDDSNSWNYVHFYERDKLLAYAKDLSVEDNKIYNEDNYDKLRLIYNNSFIDLLNNSDYKVNEHYIDTNNKKYIVSDLDEVSIINNLDLNNKIASNESKEFIYSYLYNWIYAKNLKVSKDETSYLISNKDDILFGYISNKWEKVEKYNEESTRGFTLFRLVDQKALSKNFAILINNKIINFAKGSGVDINKEDLDDSITDLLPEGDINDKYVGYQYIIMNNKKYIFIFDKETSKVELVEIIDGVFNEAIEGKIDFATALKIITINVKYLDKKTNKEVYKTMYIDFNNLIYCGNTSNKSLTSLDYIGIATYSIDKPSSVDIK